MLFLVGREWFCSAMDASTNVLPNQGISSKLSGIVGTDATSPVSAANTPSTRSTQALNNLCALLWAAFGALVSTFVSYEFFPCWRRKRLTKRLNVTGDSTQGNQTRARVYNGGFWTIKNAIIYLRLPLSKDDVLDPPPGHKAHIRPDHFVPIDEEQLCWSVRAPTVNPIKVDIYAKERQPFSPCALTDPCDKIIIPSEEGWPQPVNQCSTQLTTPYMRVFLRPKPYTGYLKVVSEDTDATFFRIEIIHDGQTVKVNIQPASDMGWNAAKQNVDRPC